MLVFREWRWISWTRSHVFHHGLALSSLIFFLVLFWVSRRGFPFWGLLQVRQLSCNIFYPLLLLLLLFHSITRFPRQRLSMVSHWSLSDCKFPQVFKILLSIPADLNNVVVWMVSTRPLISKFSIPFLNSLVTAPRAPIIIGITVNFMFHSFFYSLARSRYLSFFSFSFNLTLCSVGTAKSTIWQVLTFLSSDRD